MSPEYWKIKIKSICKKTNELKMEMFSLKCYKNIEDNFVRPSVCLSMLSIALPRFDLRHLIEVIRKEICNSNFLSDSFSWYYFAFVFFFIYFCLDLYVRPSVSCNGWLVLWFWLHSKKNIKPILRICKLNEW